MPTECSAVLFEFARVEGRSVVAGFDGGKITSDAGALLLGASDQAIGLIDRFARCFADRRSPELVGRRHAAVRGLVGAAAVTRKDFALFRQTFQQRRSNRQT